MIKPISVLLFMIGLAGIGFAQTVTIGKQVWAAKNLDLATFRNGDTIPEAKTAAAWQKSSDKKKPAWCYYNDDPENGKKYGKLYNWYAVNDPRGLAPKGYHIPSDAEWKMLTDYLGGEWVAGKKMKSTSGWSEDGNGTNSSGFSGLPGSYRSYSGRFYPRGNYGSWWSSTDGGSGNAWVRYLFSSYDHVTKEYKGWEIGLSVRCLRD